MVDVVFKCGHLAVPGYFCGTVSRLVLGLCLVFGQLPSSLVLGISTQTSISPRSPCRT